LIDMLYRFYGYLSGRVEEFKKEIG